MATNFPGSVDSLTNPSAGNTLDSPSHSGQHSDTNDAIEAIEGFLLNNYNPSFRNIIINGAMQVSQRGTSNAGTTTGGFTTDRWQFSIATQGTWTQTTENDAPTGSGFRKSTKVLCTTADASPAAGDYIRFEQRIEGQNLQQIAKGTSSAKQLTLSFWVKSNVTGTYIVRFFDNDNTREVSASYTISSSATWEKKTITVPADTTGAFDNDNEASLLLFFMLGAGSTYTSGTLNTTWNSFNAANSSVGQVNLASATNNYWQITGVQLEVGEADTPYEFLPIDVEVRRCQRYYVRSTGTAYYNHTSGGASLTTRMFGLYVCPVPLRAAPTAIEFANVAAANYGGGLNAITAMSLELTGLDKLLIYGTVASGLSANVPGAILNNNNAAGYIGFSAEL